MSGAPRAEPHGPLQLLLEGLPQSVTEGTRAPWHSLTARQRATSRPSGKSVTTKDAEQNARAHVAAQPDSRVGTCDAATKGSSEPTPALAPTLISCSPEQHPLTVKLRGRAEASAWRRGLALSFSVCSGVIRGA